MQHQVLVGGIAGDDFALDSARPLRVVTGDLSCVDGFVDGVFQAFAGLQGQCLTDVFFACFKGVRQFAQVIAAFNGG